MRSSTGRTASAASVLTLVLALMVAWSGAARAASTSGWRIAVTQHYGSARNASGYLAVVAPDRSDVWAFGGTNPGGPSAPVAMRWNGAHWQSSPLPAGLGSFIGDASAPSSRDIWAVSYAGGYALHWDGTRWSVAKRWPHQAVLTGVTALGPADVWVFGTTTAGARGMGTWHFDGRSWTQVAGRAGQIYRASALSRRDIWAVAASRRGGFAEHYDGHAWRRVDIGGALAPASLDDVLAVSRRSVWVVGNLPGRRGEGRLVVAHFDGRRWSKVPTPWHADTGRLAPDGSGGVWITAVDAGVRTHALIGHLSRQRHLTWTAVLHALGTGISDIAVSRGTGRIWLSGGFLSRAGGAAAIWSRDGDPRRRTARRDETRLDVGPEDYRSGLLALAELLRLDLAELLRPGGPASPLIRAAAAIAADPDDLPGCRGLALGTAR